MVRAADREALLRRALRLEYLTIGWMAVEALVGIGAGVAAGSAVLVAFALDSVIEMASGGVVIWRVRAEQRGENVEHVERTAVRRVGYALMALAAYVTVHAAVDLATGVHPRESRIGIGLAAVALVAMPLLAWRKRVVAKRLDSRSMSGDAKQALLCASLSAVLLAGLAVRAWLGWTWADPVAAFGIAALAAREGYEMYTTEDMCC
jgi:divalent metal cation (Fe/Co/Zn/Cd) transporter